MNPYRIRSVKTKSGATAVQVVLYTNKKRKIIRHFGSAHTKEEIIALKNTAERFCASESPQSELFTVNEPSKLLHLDRTVAERVSHTYARDFLHAVFDACSLGNLDVLYRDFAMMRILEPASKLRTNELLERYFAVLYSTHLYRKLRALMAQKEDIEKAAYETAHTHFNTALAFVLYDVTTLYFESFKEYDFQKPGFSKDNKSQQPQIVVGLLVGTNGFPLMHEVFEGNTFEGHTMLPIVEAFMRARNLSEKPIIIADAAMISRANMQKLEESGYRYIVGARLANTAPVFLGQLYEKLGRTDGAMVRLAYPNAPYDVVCAYSEKRYKKNKHDFEKHIKKAHDLIARKEPGKRAKYVKKSDDDHMYVFDEALKQKTERLLGVKGYCTNISLQDMGNAAIVEHYQQLWRVEQTFRMSKADLQTRPIFHRVEDAIRAHLIICFLGLVAGKFLELKLQQSIRSIRDALWDVHEVHLRDTSTGETFVLRTEVPDFIHKFLEIDLKKGSKRTKC